MGKIFRISLKLNFFPNTMGCFGLITVPIWPLLNNCCLAFIPVGKSTRQVRRSCWISLWTKLSGKKTGRGCCRWRRNPEHRWNSYMFSRSPTFCADPSSSTGSSTSRAFAARTSAMPALKVGPSGAHSLLPSCWQRSSRDPPAVRKWVLVPVKDCGLFSLIKTKAGVERCL